MSDTYETLVKTVEEIRPDLEKADHGNKSAATRVRKAMQDVKRLAQDLRNEMMSRKKTEEPTC